MATRKTLTQLTQPKSVTIKTLAKEVGLSITTVSRALNGYSDVSEATREKIVETAQRIGYTPNRNAQRLVTQKSHAFGWIQSDDDNKFVDPHFGEVLAGVLHQARKSNYDIIMSSEPRSGELERYKRYVREGSVDGFIIDLPRPNDARIDYLLEANVPFVVHGRAENFERYGWVDIDNYDNFYKLTQIIIENGHKKFAFINGDGQFVYADARKRAVEDALADMGLPADTVLYLEGTHPMNEVGYALTELAMERDDISAILYSSIIMAVEGTNALSRTGYVVNEDVAVFSMNDELQYLNLAQLEGKISCVCSSLRVAGRKIVDELVNQCSGETRRGNLIPSRFIMAEGISAKCLSGEN